MNSARFNNLLRMLRAARANRMLNYFSLLFSYTVSLLLRKAVRTGMPAFVAVEPSGFCNLNCPECPTGAEMLTRPAGNTKEELYTRILNEINRYTIYLTLYFQGEPFLHPRFLQMVAEAKQKRMYVVTSTNAHFLDPEKAEQAIRSGLDNIIISFDGPDAKTYEDYRKNGNWKKVLAGIRNLVEAKEKLGSKTPYIILQCLVMRSNEDRLFEVRNSFRELGADKLIFKTLQLLDPSKSSSILPVHSHFSRYAGNENGVYSIKKGLKNRCFRAWSSCVITWDGKVVPCCYDKNAEHVLGRIGDDTIHNIWKGAAAKAFLTKLLHNQKEISICRNCDG